MNMNTRKESGISVCYLPGRESSYCRNRVIVNSLRAAGLEVADCSSGLRSFPRYFVSFFRFLFRKRHCDIVLVGFLGHFLMPFVRLVTRKNILFDAFVSVYETMVTERGVFGEGGAAAAAARYVDRLACRLADKVILDTGEHIDYFTQISGADRAKFTVVPAGADNRSIGRMPPAPTGTFTVHFHGDIQALHGAEHMIAAAAMLPEVRFRIVGRGTGYTRCVKMARERGALNIEFTEGLSYPDLMRLMARAHVCLGIFGDTPKARMVVPNKVFEALAAGKPVITGDTPAARRMLKDGHDALLCPTADPEALAERIRCLKEDPAKRKFLADNGYALFMKEYSLERNGERLRKIIEDMPGKEDGRSHRG
jgi:glycosyltransferase involved in cell wall biosynthesis